MQDALAESLYQDQRLEKELMDLQDEMSALSPMEMMRKVEIKERCDEIGRCRLALFLERRNMYETLRKS